MYFAVRLVAQKGSTLAAAQGLLVFVVRTGFVQVTAGLGAWAQLDASAEQVANHQSQSDHHSAQAVEAH
jgi:hypothetical protein